jgi:diguanylate cyclase (GGDEF)-like protein/PAS domain S-box-containing protein
MESNLQIANILDSMTEGYIALDHEFCVLYLNMEAERLTGKQRELIVGNVLWSLFPCFIRTTTFMMLHKAMYDQTVEQYDEYDSNTNTWYSVHIHPAYHGLSVYIQDITDRKKAEQQIVLLTYYDGLTGLPNQRLLKERLKQIVTNMDAAQCSIAVMTIDLDRFKAINNTAGCDNGDRLMIAVSKRLASCMHHYDTLCRYEGDKFVVLLRKADRVKAEQYAKSILAAFQTSFLLGHEEFAITPSIGISFFATDGKDSENLIANSYTALRKAKEAGNSYQFYSADLNTNSNIVRDLRRAIERNELVVYYQPQVDIRSGEISGTEALIRWNHPERGVVPPDRFIPLAEETGLIIPIGEWVLKTACTQNKMWLDAGLPVMAISVNLSGKQFMDVHLVEKVKRILSETGLPPEYLALEITESIAMDVERTIKILEQLKQLGVRISMDDFGKGFSSLNYLKRFPIDTIKIDRSFVIDCMQDENDAAIVKTIIAMARSMQLNVIAEGVETSDQLAFLQESLCDEAQGYYFSRPLPAAELEQQIGHIQRVSKEVGNNRERTEQLWLEEQLRAAREDLQLTVHKQQGMTFKFKERDGRFYFTLCDGNLLRRMGFSPGQVVGKQLFDFLPNEHIDYISSYFKRAWLGEPNITFEGYLNEISYITSLSPVRRGGKIVEVIGTCSDVTELKRVESELRAAKEQLESFIENKKVVEEALRNREGQYRLITENMMDLIGLMDEEGKVIYASPSHENVLGYPVWQFEGSSAFEMIHPDDIPHVSDGFRLMLCERKPIQLEFRCKHSSGGWVILEANGSPVFTGKGDPVQFVVVARDITKRKQAEEQLHTSEKMAIVGQLAAGMAHEIRNPITTLKGFYSLMKTGLIKEQYFPVIEGEFSRIETIISEFLAFAKPQELVFKKTDLGEMIEEGTKFLESQTILRNIQLTFEKDEEQLPVLCDAKKMKQVLVHVLNNAMDSMPYGGDILIQAMQHDARRVKILVIDKGCGISEERLKKIGEPFYSTKEKGTGLGLMICDKIIREHRGMLTIQSEVDQGTIVTIVLPKASGNSA